MEYKSQYVLQIVVNVLVEKGKNGKGSRDMHYNES
jgi:hypothetical protein